MMNGAGWALGILGITLAGICMGHQGAAATHGPLVQRGRVLFMRPRGIGGNALACTSCHLEGGRDPDALPLLGVAAQYPRYSSRAHRTISLSNRINQCIVYSLKGRRLPDHSVNLEALSLYVSHLEGVPTAFHPLRTTGQPNLAMGRSWYERACVSCHGMNGQGEANAFHAPPLWGSQSFTRAAGLAHPGALAAFIQKAMPLAPEEGVNPGGLREHTAIDIAEYILAHSRPKA